MELNELQILQRKAGTQHHAAAVTCAGVRRGCREIGTTIAAGGQNDRLSAEAVDRPVFHAHSDDATAFRTIGAVFHDEIEREIFDVEVRVILQALLVERVEHGVAGAVSSRTGALHRGAFAHILHVAAERTLVDRAIVVAAERHACVLQLINSGRRFTHHIFDRVLIPQPVRPLHGVVHVPGPVIGRVVAEAGCDAALRCNRVAARREDLGDAGRLQTGFRRAHRRTQARAARADNDNVIGVINDLVGFGHQLGVPVRAILAMANSAKAPVPSV